MHYKKILAVAISICLFETSPIFAATSSTMSEADLENSLQKLTSETAELQQEVTALKTELKQVKQSKQQRQVIVTQAATPTGNAIDHTNARYTYTPDTTDITGETTNPIATKAASNATASPEFIVAGPNIVRTANGQVSGYHPGQLISSSVAINDIGQPILTLNEQFNQERTADIKYLVGAVVLNSPILNIHSAYDASDLIVNQSTMNEDLRFLQQRQTLEELVGADNLPSLKRPQVFLSGKLEPQFLYFDGFGGPASTAIDIGSAEFDVLAEASPWAYGFMSFNFDPGGLRDPEIIGSGNPVNNSRIFLKRGFITIGNLDQSPLYFSMGQEYVPFGDYGSYLLSNPDPLSEGRTNARTAVLGFFHKGLYLSSYVFNGAVNSESGFDANHVYEWGSNAGYKFTTANGSSGNLGVGYINNIAEAQGYQINGLGTGSFQGFAADPNTEILAHPVGGFDAHLSGSMGPWSTYNEFVTATEQFSNQDLTFNGQGAQPSALHDEVDYTIKNIFDTDRNLAIFLAYDHSWQSLALNIPENSYIGGLSTSIWKNTIEAIEFRHDTNYTSRDTASGICDPDNNDDTTLCPVTVLGPTQNQVIAQIGVYF